MLLACPHCETQFQVAAAAIGDGRTVRCASCRNSWFAEPELVFAEPAMAEAGGEASNVSFETEPVQNGWTEAPADIEKSPSIAVDIFPEISVSPEDRIAEPVAAEQIEEMAQEHEPKAAPRPVRKQSRVRNYRLSRPVAIAFVLAILSVVSLLGPRESIVRILPDLAGAYAAVGLPVNLRGLEFRGVKTAQETQDGIPVLVIEGEVVNIAKHPVEVPRVRIAVLGSARQELYSWTTLLQRSILADNEKVSFRSRLASPPPDGQEVLVRFLTRNDLTGGAK
jgi:predicted Zn finger-like uncharacterized protein